MKQAALTLIATIKNQNLEALRVVLSQKNEMLKSALRSIGTIHYSRWVIVDETVLDNKTLPPQLVFSSNFDGDVNQHIEDLAGALGNLADDIYTNCIDYTANDRAGYFRKIRTREMAFYQGSPGRTVKIIGQERQLKDRIFQLKNKGDWKGKSAQFIHQSIQKEVFADPEFEWAKTNLKTPGINWIALILFGLVLLILSPILILWALFIQVFYESRDKHGVLKPNQLNDTHLTKMQLDEDFEMQNQFSQILNMKPGRARLITVNALYVFTRVLIKIFFVKGKLMGIPTIHFARWVMVNDNKRMLFFSNFDGSWTQYLGDFIDKSGWGLTGIFGNTIGFPKSLFLILKGAYDQQRFLAWSRNTQIQTQLWYTASTAQSIKNINNNTLIRNELSQALSEKKAQLFLSRI